MAGNGYAFRTQSDRETELRLFNADLGYYFYFLLYSFLVGLFVSFIFGGASKLAHKNNNNNFIINANFLTIDVFAYDDDDFVLLLFYAGRFILFLFIFKTRARWYSVWDTSYVLSVEHEKDYYYFLRALIAA